MSDRRGIASAGNWIVDNVKMIDHLPKEEHLVVISEESRGTGGASYNVLVNLAVMDPKLQLEAIGIVGDDERGAYILDHLSRLKIDARGMNKTAKAPTSYTDVMTVCSTGRRTFFHNHGANALLGPEHFNFTEIRSRILHLGYLMLLDGLDVPDPDCPERTRAASLLKKAQEHGLITSVDIVTDLGPRIHQVVEPALRYTDYFIANELESAAIAGIPLRDDDGQLIASALPDVADRLFMAGVKRLVVIHSPEGGYWQASCGAPVFQPSLKVPQEFIKGTAGAGDAFCAGILYGLHEGWDAERCLRLAVANAAQSLSNATTTGGILPLEETLKLIDRFGFRESKVVLV